MRRRLAARERSPTGLSRQANPGDSRPLLSVIVPVFNEQETVGELLEQVLVEQCDKEIIVVDDGSSDQTSQILRQWQDNNRIQLIHHERNRGKGAAIRMGLKYARGQFTIIQDADFEYDPQDYLSLLAPLLSGEAQVVYGSRYFGRDTTRGKRRNLFRFGVSLLNLCVRAIYGVRLTDEATCYKAFPTAVLNAMELQCERFEFCSEVTAKACRMGLKIHEIPISYRPRTASAGKKIRYRDGVTCIWTLWKWRNWEPQVVAVPAGATHAESMARVGKR
jgi:dolichol-phosphate mannosyltransferase